MLEPYFSIGGVELYCGDCLEVMPQLDSKVDMVLCDLPYGVTARNAWDAVIPFDSLWDSYWKLVKGNGAVVLTATEPFASSAVCSQMRYFRYDLIWSKPMATGFLNANRMPLRSHEQVLVFYRSLPTYSPQKVAGTPYRVTRRGDTTNYNKVSKLHWETDSDGMRFPKSVMQFPWDKDKLHPTQKPVALFEYLIRTYTNENEIVLDNCAGSGTAGVACINTNRRAILIEKEEEYCAITAARILKAYYTKQEQPTSPVPEKSASVA